MNISARRRYILQATIAYALMALSWIFLSDQLIAVFLNVQSLLWLSTVKGVFFVLASAAAFSVALNAVPPETEIPAQPADMVLPDTLDADSWPRWLIYGVAIALVLTALLARLHLPLPIKTRPLMLLFLLPVLIAALSGGVGPGLTATIGTALIVLYFLIPPLNSTGLSSHYEIFQLVLLIVSGVTVSIISEAMRQSRRRAKAARIKAEQALAALRESEERLKLFIGHAPASLAMFDREMRYLAVSRRWLDDYSLGDSDIIGRSHYTIFPEIGEHWKAIYRRGLAGEVIRADEDRLERADGTVHWLRWEVRPWRTATGAIGGIVIFSEDVTRSRQAEEEIRRLNASLECRVAERTAELTAANKELDSFAYAVSHDLRAPLRAMNGFSRALIEDFGGSLHGDARMYLDQIIIGSRKMGELIDGLLTLSRSTRGTLQRDTVNLSVMAEQLLDTMAREEANREVRFEIEPDLTVRGDAAMLEVVMQNVLANAWKYTSRREYAVIRVFSKMEEANRFICIADNGAGFEAAHAGKLFQPFQRLHRQEEFPGIGIGLATVQRIIHRHGGELCASGEKDKGATFCFSLPLHERRTNEEP